MDDYYHRKVHVIREWLIAAYPAPYVVEAALPPRRDPLADTKFKVLLDGRIDRLLAVCPGVLMDTHPTPDLLKQALGERGILAKVQTATELRLCHEDLGTEEEPTARPLRSVRGAM